MSLNIEELKSFSLSELDDMDKLMHELSPTSSCNKAILQAVMEDGNSHLYILRSGPQIVGSATLCVAHTPETALGFVESVVISSSWRGNGYGKMLMEHLLQEAKRLGIDQLHLTSNSRREAANGLYKRLGFVQYDTNCYKLEIK